MLLGFRSTLLSSVAFSPASLFAAGEQGVWYDPSDMTTLFQDSSGTTPVTAVEQPVGLMLDKSKSGVGTNGAKRVNLLTWTEDFSNAAWTKGAATITADAVIAPNGTTTADAIFENVPNSAHFISSLNVGSSNVNNTFKFYVKANGRTAIRAYLVQTGAAGYIYSDFDLSTGSVYGSATVVGTASTPSSSIQSVGNGWYLCAVGGIAGTLATTVYVQINLLNSLPAPAGDAYPGDITKGIYIWGADLRLASEASTVPTPYQRIDASWSATMPGNHATQATPSARPVLSARVNLLTKTEEFNDAYWGTASRVTISANTADTTDPLGGNTADKMIEVAATGTHRVQPLPAGYVVTGGATQTLQSKIRFKKGTRDWVWLSISDSGGTNQCQAWYDLTNGVVGTVTNLGIATGASATITPDVNGWFICQLSGKSSTIAGDATVFYGMATGNGVNSYAGDITKHVYLWGADLRVANDTALPVYQRVDTSTSYDTTGFPMYLRFDGSDDAMATASIDFSVTNKMTVFAGVRKLSDSVSGAVVSLGTYISGNTFELQAPSSAAPTSNYLWATHGNGANITNDDFNSYRFDNVAAPITNVLTGSADRSIQNPNGVSLRNNGVTAARTATAFTGLNVSGNFDNAALTIGRRSTSPTIYLNGRLYSLIVRGAATSAADITSTETWINDKTKAY
jgi:hypothetical protein